MDEKGVDPDQLASLEARGFGSTVKPVLSGHSKIDKTKILMTNGTLMKVENTMYCRMLPIGAFCNTFDLH